MKLFTRRVLLKAFIVLGLSPLFPKILLAAPYNSNLFKNMDALTETIMPGTAEMGIHNKVRETVLKVPETARICIAGLETIEKYSLEKYGKSFHSLGNAERDIILKRIAEIPEDKFQGFFFKKFRETVLAFYYTSPEVWKILRYNGPPQPNGFMDYHLPPKSPGKSLLVKSDI